MNETECKQNHGEVTSGGLGRASARRWLAAACWILVAGCGFWDRPSATSSGDTSLSPAPTVELEHDAVGNLIKVAHARGMTQLAYDGLDRAIQSTDALAGKTSSTWTESNGLTGVTDPKGVVTRYERNGHGDVTRIASPDTGETTKAYDEAGNLVSSVDARGATTRYRYDALDRLVSVSYEQSGEAELAFSFGYDDVTAAGRLTATTFPEGSTGLTYDTEGQLVAATQQVGGVTTVVRYAYDAAGHVTQLTYPSGRRLEITWTDGAPSALAVSVGEERTPLVDGLVLDPHGDPERWSWPLQAGPRAHEVERDTWGRLVRYPLGSRTRVLTYDAAGRIVSYTHVDAAGTAQPDLDEAFSYDELDRLVGFTRNGSSQAVAYDATGNRITAGTRSFLTDDRSNRLVSTTEAGVMKRFTFDAAGNLVGDEVLTATYDASGRMASSTRGGVTTRYAYDGAGRRVHKHSENVDLYFVHDAVGRLLGEYDATGAPAREYVWLGHQLVAFYAGRELLFVHSDHLGAPRIAFDTQGRDRWRWLSPPFGEATPENDPAGLGAIELPLRFPGQYADPERGLFYNHFRDYDPATGRYVQSDPIGLEGGINTYAYVAGNPVSRIDPDGRFFFLVPLLGYSAATALGDLAIAGGLWWWATQPPVPSVALPGYPGNDGGPFARPDPIESRRSDKERATDVPSWSKQHQRKPGQSCADFAEEVLNEHYGCDHPKAKDRGPGSEYSKIKKHCERK